MTVKELKVEAKKLGYLLIKIKEKVLQFPCPVCGKKNTTTWYIMGGDGGSYKQCNGCGFKGFPSEKNSDESVKEAWNKAVEAYVKENNHAED